MSDEEQKAFFKTLKLNHVYPEDLKSYYVDNVVVQHKPDRFILSFFEVFEPPILGETEEERKREVESLESIEAKCVARLIVTPNRMQEFIDVLNQNMSKYQILIEKLFDGEETI